jgi:hypothetical protein
MIESIGKDWGVELLISVKSLDSYPGMILAKGIALYNI